MTTLELDTTTNVVETDSTQSLQDGVTVILDRFRVLAELTPKGKYRSNFDLTGHRKAELLEAANILRTEFDEIFNVLLEEEEGHEPPAYVATVIKQGGVLSSRHSLPIC